MTVCNMGIFDRPHLNGTPKLRNQLIETPIFNCVLRVAVIHGWYPIEGTPKVTRPQRIIFMVYRKQAQP